MYTWNSAGAPKLAQTITFRKFFSLDELEKTPLGVEIVDMSLLIEMVESLISLSFLLLFFSFSLLVLFYVGGLGK